MATNLVLVYHILVEMIYPYFGLQLDGMIVVLHITAQLFLSSVLVKLRIILNLFQLVTNLKCNAVQ